MSWSIYFHPGVEKDFKRIDPAQHERILATIEEKLSSEPTKFGKQLRKPFSKYRSLRVNKYRVIYQVIRDKVRVLVLKVGIRRDSEVYRELFSRLRKT